MPSSCRKRKKKWSVYVSRPHGVEILLTIGIAMSSYAFDDESGPTGLRVRAAPLPDICIEDEDSLPSLDYRMVASPATHCEAFDSVAYYAASVSPVPVPASNTVDSFWIGLGDVSAATLTWSRVR